MTLLGDARDNQVMQKRTRMPRDPNQLAKLIADMAYGEAEPEPEKPAKNPAAVALGKLGGAKGGKARAAKLTPEERSQAAKKAARTRWDHRQSAS